MPLPSALYALSAVATLVAAGLVVKTHFDVSDRFGWHASCMAVAFIFLMPFGSQSAGRRHSTSKPVRRESFMTTHMYAQFLAFLLAMGGGYAIYSNKDLNGKEHYTSTHSYFGGAALLFTFLNWAAGAYFYSQSGFKWTAAIHRAGGLMAMAASFGAVYMAMEYEWIADSYGPYKKMILGAMGLAILLVPISHIVGQKGGKAAQD